MISLDPPSHRDPTLGFFRFGKMKTGGYLITNDIGRYAHLSDGEFSRFLSGNLSDERRKELITKCFYKTPGYEQYLTDIYRQRNQFLAYGPALHTIIVTLRCNHSCRYCHAAAAPMSAKDLDMSQETADHVLDTIFYTSSPEITIEFQGGEPLVNYPIVQHIVEEARLRARTLGKNLTLALVTNLSLMDDEKLDWLISRGVGICTSLDGDRMIHNYQRIWKEGDSYEKVSYWIPRINTEMRNRGLPSTYSMGALATWTKKSISQYEKVLDTYVSLGLDTIGFRWLNPYGFAAADRDDMAFSPREFIDFYTRAMDRLLEINRGGYRLREMLSSVYLSKMFFDQDGSFMDIRSPGGLGIGTVAYTYDRLIYASDESRMLGRMGQDDWLLTPLLDTGKDTYTAMSQSLVTRVAVEASTLDGLPGYSDHVYRPYMGVDILYSYTQHGSPYSLFARDEKNQMQIGILDYLFDRLRDPENETIFRSWFE